MIPRAAWAAALCLAVVASPAPLHAAVRPFIGLGGGWGTHAMSDINAEIRAINQAAAPFRLAEISSGTTVGAEVGVKLPGGRTLAVAYDRVSASSFTGDPSLYLQYDLPASVFRFSAAQTVRLHDRLGARVGGSIGVLSEKGMFRVVAPGAASQMDLRGKSAMGEVFGGLGLAAGRHCDLALDAGYRRAKAADITVEGTPLLTPTGGRATVDYSGFLVRASVQILLAH